MEATSGGAGGSRGGGMGNEAARVGSGGGLARFRSAPATWLDALLEDDLTRDDALKVGPSSGGLTELLTAGTTNPPSIASAGGSSGLVRSNSSSSYSISAAADPEFFDGTGGPHQSNLGGFHRQSSSPAEFLSGNIDGYFSNFAMSGNYDFFAGSQTEISPTGKRMRETDSDLPSPSKFTQLKGEPSSLLDLEMDKLLEDSVPCRLRAKRGCATHPRSIAERVRRTRISDRIRKLQELVPNMDKQTNTADMLEEAVEYVKRLQEQIEVLLKKDFLPPMLVYN
ncbi:hypothetical protein V2J09_024367 [Rumex salicifolius]